jgi:ribonuclease HI
MRTEWSHEVMEWIQPNSIEFYTDGSLMAETAGAGIYEGSTSTEISIPLGSTVTVFQAELYAIYTAANLALQKKWRNKAIYFHSDSQAAIKSLSSGRINSNLVEKCILTLNKLGRKNKVTVDWVPGHSDIPGNERADALARQGSSTTRSGTPRAVKWSYSLLKHRTSEWLRKQHQRCWTSREDCRQTKMFVQGPSKNRTSYLLSLKKSELRTLIGVVTGHCPLNNHMKTMRLANSPTCNRCLEEDETVEHFLCRCPAFSQARNRNIGGYELDSEELCSIDLNNVLKFVKRSGRFRDMP